MLGRCNAPDAEPVAVEIRVVVEHEDLDRFILQGGGLVIHGFGCVVDRSDRDFDRRGVGKAALIGDDIGEAVEAVIVRVWHVRDARSIRRHLGSAVFG